MSYRKQLHLLLSLLISIVAFNQNQADQLDTLAGHFISDLRTEEHEKIIVHTDKWFYLAGEEVWFKAYSINSISGKYFLYSKTLFADLVNDQDSVIARLMLNNGQQQTAGMILLPSSLKGGYYWLRAYTQNILQEDSSHIFVQPLYVINKSLSDDQLTEVTVTENDSQTTDSSKPIVTFFPEGGSLISGTNALVGFRAIDAKGKLLDISGYITDSWDSVVSRFSTAMPGLGKFNFFVWRSRKYTAHIKWKEQEIMYPLPLVDHYASQLSVQEQDDNLLVRISLGDSLYKRNKLTYLLAVSRDILGFAGIGKDMYETAIPKKNFPPGRAVLLLFNDQYKVISERSVYINYNNIDSITIKPDKTNYASREKVNLDIIMGDTLNRSASVLFSLAVTDDNFAKQASFKTPVEILNESNIELPPAADIKNYSAPDWDIIMLTNKPLYTGWKYLNTKPVHIFNEDTIFYIRGRIINNKNQPVTGRVVTLFSNRNTVIALTDTTNTAGHFNFSLPAFTDSTLFMLQVTNKKGFKQDEQIIVNTFHFPQFKTPAYLKKKFSIDQLKVIRDFKNRGLDTLLIGSGKEWLKPVVVKSFKKKPANSIDNKRISSFSRIITGEQLENKGSFALGDAMLSVPGMHLRQGFLVVGGPMGFNVSAKDEPLLVVDGVEFPTMDSSMGSPLLSTLQQFPPAIVDFVEVFTGPEAAVYGLRGGAGVIYIHTRSSARVDTSAYGKGVLRIMPKGYFEAPAFISPDYAKKAFKQSPYPDHRSTIFWNGSVLTEKNGKATVNFFTADEEATYTVTITGVTAKGDLIYKQSKISRK